MVIFSLSANERSRTKFNLCKIAECILNMFSFISKQIEIDLSRNVIAKWHDESHSNKFFILYTTKVLSPEYCYNKSSCSIYKELVPRVVQVFKDENEMRKI